MPYILLIDDDPAVRSVYGAGLRARGYAVQEMSNGCGVREAIASAPVDLLIMDIIMPDCDGFEVLNQLTRATVGIPILSISGTHRYLDISESLGCPQTLLKPFTIPQLVSAVETTLAGQPHPSQGF